VDGEVYAMAGASDRHNRIALNIASRLNDHLTHGSCEAFISDMKIKTEANVYYYPDVVVTCDPPSGRDPYFRTEPRLVIEVISPSTARIDRGEKLTAYKRVASVQEYVMVMQDEMYVEVHRRGSDSGEWIKESFTQADERVYFSSIDFGIKVGDIYRNLNFEDNVSLK
jgi:Uma2 family endonuclease